MLSKPTERIALAAIKNSHGNFSVIAIISIFACVLFFYLINAITPLLDYKRQIVASSIKTNLVMALENIKATLNNTEAIKAIVNLPENAALKCLPQGTCSSTMAPQPLKVTGLDGAPLSNGTSVGIDSSGHACAPSSSATNCLFIVQVKWRPLCPEDGTSCINPPVEIFSETAFAGLWIRFVVNFGNIDFKIRLSSISDYVIP